MRRRDAQIFRHARHIQTAFRRGRLIAYATESCFGLGCDPKNRSALKRLLRIKRRPWQKGLLLVADRASRLEPFIVAPNVEQQIILAASWPGPNTWIIKAAERIPRALTGKHDAIGVRVTAHSGAAAIARIVRRPIVSTSANVSGRIPFKSYRDCVRRFGAVAFVVPGKTGAANRPSTIRVLATGQVVRH